MNYITALILLCVLYFSMLIYLKIAKKYNIIDKPNERSSHSNLIIRGGGVIFPIAVLLQFFIFGFHYQWFVFSLILISAISFIDDINPVSNRIRLLIHLIAVAILFFEVELFNQHWYLIAIAFVFVIGTINAINFMDGINGITGGYGLITLITFFYINKKAHFIDPNFLIVVIVSVLVFNFFNFRKQAKCFAGDVGSISLAFIIVFLLIKLLLETGNFSYIFLLSVYGLDVVSTILFRLIRKENITLAHRTHFYQFLANERKMPHLRVTLLYCLAQVFLNICLICFPVSSLAYNLIILLILGTLIVILRFVFEGYRKLTNSAGID